MRPGYDFDYSKGACGKYYKRVLEEGSSVAVPRLDVVRAFRTSAAVNEVLGSLLAVSEATRRVAVLLLFARRNNDC